MKHQSTKVIPLGSATFRQWRAKSHCKYIHGYRLKAKLWFEANELDINNWVFDFGNCKQIKTLLENQFDHTFCCAGDDPLLGLFRDLDKYEIIQLRVMNDGVGIEKTAEWIYNEINDYLTELTKGRVTISKVEVWEHESNSAIYNP